MTFASFTIEGVVLSKAPTELEINTWTLVSVSKRPFKTRTGSCTGISRSITVSISPHERVTIDISEIIFFKFFIIKILFGKKLKELLEITTPVLQLYFPSHMLGMQKMDFFYCTYYMRQKTRF